MGTTTGLSATCGITALAINLNASPRITENFGLTFSSFFSFLLTCIGFINITSVFLIDKRV